MPITSECTFQTFELILDKEIVTDNSSIGLANECTFSLPVFAYLVDTDDDYRNDFTTSLLPLSNRYNDPKIFLEKEVSCNVFVEVSQLTDNTYGIFHPITSIAEWIGYRIIWHKVFTLEGSGCFRIRQEYTDITDGSVKIKYSYKYNLNLFTKERADNTTKLTYTIRGGIIGSTIDDTKTINYQSIIWDREIRLPRSFFGFESSEYTRESVRYKNGAETQIVNNQVEELKFNAKKLPYSLHREIKITALQSGELFISDYNLGNPATIAGVPYDHKRVSASSSYEPKWATYNSYAPVELTFKPYFENLRRKRC
jgi:hypothetical protein